MCLVKAPLFYGYLIMIAIVVKGNSNNWNEIICSSNMEIINTIMIDVINQPISIINISLMNQQTNWFIESINLLMNHSVHIINQSMDPSIGELNKSKYSLISFFHNAFILEHWSDPKPNSSLRRGFSNLGLPWQHSSRYQTALY